MYKGKLLALIGMAVLGVAVFAVTNYFPVSAESNLLALIPDPGCVATRYGDDGTTLTPYGPNACHKQKVFMDYGTYSYGGTRYETANMGNSEWSSWRVRCPAGSTVQTHGRYHYGFSPNISGLYDAPSHSFCVDSSGNEVAPLPGESETYPNHTHSIYPTKVSLSKVKIVDTGQELYWAHNPTALGWASNYYWAECTGGASGPYPQNGTTMDTTKDFPNHYHCNNPGYTLGSSLNPESLPIIPSNVPGTSEIGDGFSPYTSGTKDQFVDKATNQKAPIGTISCQHTGSDKSYFSTTGTCPGAGEFPLRPSFTWTESTPPLNNVNIQTGAEVIYKANLANTGTTSTTYAMTCSVSPYRPVSYKMLAADNTTIIPLASGQLTVGVGVSSPSQVWCAVDMSGGTASSNYTITFNAYPSSDTASAKTLSSTYTSGAYIGNSCTSLNLTTDAASYVKGTNVNYTYSCATPAAGTTINTAIVQVVKPDGTITTYVTGSNISTPTTQMGFGTDNLPAGAYTLRVCMETSCPAATTVSKAFAVTDPTTTTPGAGAGTSGICLIRSSSASIPILDTPLSSTSNSGYNWEFVVKPGVNTINGLKTACTTAEYDAMWTQFCSGWPGEQIQYEVVTVNGEDKFQSSSCDDSGCDSHTCPTTVTPPPPTTTCAAGTVSCPAISGRPAGCYSTCSVAPPTGTTCGTGQIWCPGPATAVGGAGYCGSTCSSTTTPGTTGPGTYVPPNSNCGNDETCSAGSQCSNGQKCYYPDNKITCKGYAWADPALPGMSLPGGTAQACPAGTSPCDPNDPMCHAKELGDVPYRDGMWCQNGQKYFKTVDGVEMIRCFNWNETVLSGYSTCRASDTNCVAQGGYGSENAQCSSMRCYQSAEDDNSNNDMYCAPPPAMTTTAMPVAVSCPAGYSQCSKNERANGCRSVGETWTIADEGAVASFDGSIYCRDGNSCRNSAGGGSCVSWNESCPAGTLYCPADTGFVQNNCVEPGNYINLSELRRSDGGYNYPWCGGGGGMTFFSSTQAYCPPKKAQSNTMTMMWTGAEVKATLDTLGSGWGLCNPNQEGSYGKCGEPGERITANDWCAWMPPMPAYSGVGPSYTSPPQFGDRTCSSLDGATQPQDDDDDDDDKPTVCLQVITDAYNPTTGECKVFNNSCIPEGWRPSPAKCGGDKPQEPEYCTGDEVPGPANFCRLPSYKLHIDTCDVRKCSEEDLSSPYVQVKGNDKVKFTSCQPMMSGQIDWNKARCEARPPREFGQQYWLEWDTTAPTLKYSPKSDSLVKCDPRENIASVTAPEPGTYFRCEYVPKRDQKWWLLRERAEYNMGKLYREQHGNGGIVTPVTPVINIPDIPKDQCVDYLAEIRIGIMGDKQYWKDMRRQADQVPEDYPGKSAINDLLSESKDLIVKIERGLRKNDCGPSALMDIQLSLHALHNEIFTQLSSYMPDINDFVQYGFCSGGLAYQANQLEALIDDADLSKADKTLAKEWLEKIEDAKDELDKAQEDGDFDAVYRCQNFMSEVHGSVSTLFRKYDVELNRIIDDIISDRLDSVLSELSEQLAQRERKIDELLVQVAELHKKVEALSENLTEIANQFTEKLTVSYSALAKIENKFAEQKLQIEAAKDRLTGVVEKAIQTMNVVSCVSDFDRDSMINEFSTVASVNWIDDEEVDEMERRINLFIASCTANDLENKDITEFSQHIAEASADNLTLSFEQGLTPFQDVPTHTWFYGDMAECYRRGCMTQGRPGEAALRQDALLMLLRESGAGDADIVGTCTLPTGVEASGYASCAISHAESLGLAVSGDMKLPATREEIAYWIDMLKIVPNAVAVDPNALNNYVDVGAVNSAYLNSVRFVVTNGVMVGQVGPTTATFQPHEYLTRAALSVVLGHIRD